MAMWLTKQRGTEGPVFGSADKFEGLGIFIDTYKNNRPGVVFPYVMAMVGDGQTTYDSASDGQANEVAGCSARGIRGAEVPTKLRLTYFQDSYLRLELQYKDGEDWTQCFETSKVKIPSVAYLGFSAHTGELSDNHDIVRVEARNLYSTAPESSKPDQKKSELKDEPVPKSSMKFDPPKEVSEGGSWKWFFLKIVLVLIVVAGGYVGYTIWRTQRRGSRF
ncbi:MAG: Vesicular integral-membrane protein VIP36 [Piccolia ochrophora]|nr:MAG: Vesicular integral-membrane protein VIP36 [Piccolia ochrophora]